MGIIKKNKYRLLSKFIKYGFVFVIAFTLVSPLVFATGGPCTGFDPVTHKPTPTDCDPTIKPDSGNTTPKPDSGNTTPSINITSGIKNPLGDNLTTIPDFITAIINIVLIIGIPIVALAIIYSGFLFVTAAGNSEKLGKAKKAIMYTLIGAALLLGAFVIANAIKSTVLEIKS